MVSKVVVTGGEVIGGEVTGGEVTTGGDITGGIVTWGLVTTGFLVGLPVTKSMVPPLLISFIRSTPGKYPIIWFPFRPGFPKCPPLNQCPCQGPKSKRFA